MTDLTGKVVLQENGFVEKMVSCYPHHGYYRNTCDVINCKWRITYTSYWHYNFVIFPKKAMDIAVTGK